MNVLMFALGVAERLWIHTSFEKQMLDQLEAMNAELARISGYLAAMSDHQLRIDSIFLDSECPKTL